MQVHELDDWIAQWRQDLAAIHASHATLDSYATALRSFQAYARHYPAETTIDTALVVAYAGSLQRLAPKTQHCYTGALIGFLTYLIAEGITGGYPDRGRLIQAAGLRRRLRAILPPPPLPEAPEMPDLRPMIIHYDRPLPEPVRDERLILSQLRNSALLHTLLSTAGRINEVLSLNAQQVRRLDGSIVRSVAITGKGRKQRPLLLRDHARTRIALYLERRQQWSPHVVPLFCSHGPRNAGGRLSDVQALRVVWDAAEAHAERLRRKGADAETIAPVERVSPHAIRHFVAFHLLNEGVSLSEISAILGHTSTIITEQVYAAHRRRQLAETHDTFAPDPLPFYG